MRIAHLLVLLVIAGSPVAGQELTAPSYDDAFWKHWGDGQAELASYDLEFTRYGSRRTGTAVTIFVTETFSNEARVKADPGRHPEADTFPVMKLNLVEDFPTGIYDYNIMTSAFTALTPVNGRPAGTPTKISFSAQEWCGHVYQQTLFHADQVVMESHSYFDGEADQRVELSADGVLSEDALWFWARGLSYPRVEPGESVTLPLLRSAKTARLLHRPVQWETTELAVGPEILQIDAVAGITQVRRKDVRIQGDRERTWTFWVEEAWPHRIVRWENSQGQRAELVAVERIKYWELNGPGREADLARLGLSPRAPRVP